MKRMLYVVIMILSVNANAQSSIPEFFGSADKQLHMGGCYVISSMTTALVYKRTGDRRTAIAIGLGTGIALGVAKELYDIKYGNPELGDIAADVIGAGLGVLCVRITF
jgi:VanZ family protein